MSQEEALRLQCIDRALAAAAESMFASIDWSADILRLAADIEKYVRTGDPLPKKPEPS